jgi:hypothetical protein
VYGPGKSERRVKIFSEDFGEGSFSTQQHRMPVNVGKN